MYIYELATGQEISIIAHFNEDAKYFKSTITEVYPRKQLSLSAPVYRKGKAVSFQTQGLTTDIMTYPSNDKPQMFENVTITLMKKADNILCYRITSPAESIAYNRRQYFRCILDLKAPLRAPESNGFFNVQIKDVSLHGFAFTYSNKAEFKMGENVFIELIDYLAEYEEHLTFRLNGIIVRSYAQQDGEIVYGCRMDSRVHGLDIYIMKKERIRLKTNNSNNNSNNSSDNNNQC